MIKAAELKVFRQTLESLRARLRGDVTTMADAALRHSGSDATGDLSRMPIHMADIGSDAYEQEFTLSLMANEEETLELVEQALQRIKAKKFGTCEECSGVIAKKRLEAIPFASMCIRCAEKMENGVFDRPRQPR
jgi:RNA polymerase-binding transcription factor DksA